MRTSKFETIHQLTFMPHSFPINCYLCEEDDDITLIDTGMGFCWKGILEASSKIGKPISRIALTHPHADHCGAIDKLRAHLPQVEVYVSELDSADIKGHIKVSEGDVIKSLTVISLPGHTPGSIAFYDNRSKILIAGDAFQTRGGVAVAGDMRIGFPFPAAATWNKKIAVESAEKINKLDIRFLAVGHGNMLPIPYANMNKVLQRAKDKLK